MKIELEDGHVKVYAEDGRQMFEVCAGKDERSLTIRGINTCKIGDALYSAYLQVEPNAANSITVRTRECE
jgi:hypothetical protein